QPAFGLRDTPGPTGLKEVTASGTSSFATDVVAGFAPYLFNDFIDGGVSVARPPAVAVGFPYVGARIVGIQNSSVTALTSFFFAASLDLKPSISIALAYVLRRTTELPAGYAVGSPYSGTELATVSGWGHGVAVIVNLTPEFFRIGGG